MLNVRWFVPSLAIGAALGLGAWIVSRNASDPGVSGFEGKYSSSPASGGAEANATETGESATGEAPIANSVAIQQLVGRLERNQWPAAAVQAFVSLNREWIEKLANDRPEQYQRLCDRLIRIEPSSRYSAALGELLAERPELAGYASILRPDANCSLEWPVDTDERTIFVNCLVLANDGPSARQLALAWKRHGRTIRGLWVLGLAGCERLFMFDRRDEADEEYDRWLTTVFEQVEEVSGKRRTGAAADRFGPLLSRVCLVAHNGEKLHQRLRSDTNFARIFRQELWPKLDRICRSANRPLELFLQDDRIWQLLAMPRGEELASRYGILPVEIFFGSRKLPDDLHPLAAEMLVEGRAGCIFGLLDTRLRSDPQFHYLLRNKPVPPATMAVAIEHLRQENQAYRTTLGKYLAMPPDELITAMQAPFDVESWDDSLPAYLKYAKRFAFREQQDEGDLGRAVAVGVEHLGTVVEYIGEPVGEATGYPIVGKVVSGVGQGVSLVAAAGEQWATAAVERRKSAYRSASRGVHPQEITEVATDQALLLASTRLMQTLSEIQTVEPVLDPRLTWKSYCFFANCSPVGKRHLAKLEQRLRFVISTRNEMVPGIQGQPAVTDVELSLAECHRAQSLWWLECLVYE